MQVFISSLATISVVFEILTLIFAFYFKQGKIFFLTFALFLFRFLYFFAPLDKVNLLLAIFLPLLWFLFCLLPSKNLLFSRLNLSKTLTLLFLFFFFLFCLKLPYINTKIDEFLGSYENFTELILLPFLAIFILLALISFFKAQRYQALSLVLAHISFFTNYTKEFFYFEFASLFFLVYIFYDKYKELFFDPLTFLPNENSLKRFIKARENLKFMLLKFELLDSLQEKYARLYLKKMAKILRYLSKDYKIFSSKSGFIFVCDNEVKLTELEHVISSLKNTEIKIRKERISLPISTKMLDEKGLKAMLT